MAIALRHVLQHLSQSCQHPSVASCPEVFLPRRRLMLREDVFSVAEVQSCLAVEHYAVAVADVVVQFVQIAHVARQAVHLGHHGHHHVQCVGPPPVVVDLALSHIPHHLASPGHTSVVGHHAVEVDISLETRLPVAEEHVLVVLAVLLVLPLPLVPLLCSLPLVVLRPPFAVAQVSLLAGKTECLHVARVIGCLVPEGAHLCRMALLPCVVHLHYHLSYGLSLLAVVGCLRPLCRQESEGKGKNKRESFHIK